MPEESPQNMMIKLCQKRIIKELKNDECDGKWVDRAMAFCIKMQRASPDEVNAVEASLARLEAARKDGGDLPPLSAEKDYAVRGAP